MSFAGFYLLTVLVHLPGSAAQEKGGFLHQPLPPPLNRSDVESVLLSEFSNAFRDGTAREHISKLEAELNTMYMTLPKDDSGGLGHASVRYALHRLFVKKFGWFIRGLEPGNTSAAQAAAGENVHRKGDLLTWVPEYMQKFVEEMQGGRGLKLRELAVLAATLEGLIHKEANQRLEMTFIALDLPFSSLLDGDQMREALEIYMMIYMMNGDFTIRGRAGVLRLHEAFHEKIKGWDKTQKWMQGIQAEVAQEKLDFTGASRVVEEVGRRYGTFNDGDCEYLTKAILEIESTKAGRVRLPDFYKTGLTGIFEFDEKIEYLRALGAVDESNTSEPYVIIPNYIASRPNCLVGSDFYVVCCQNECENLMSTIEKKFQKTTANPKEILELVATFSTKTVEAPRTLSDTLVRRLNLIADANQGQVPLHGRLFAQWLHHAFPRECPYPHQSTDITPMSADEWIQATGQESSKKTSEEMQVIVDSDSCILPVGEKAREQHDLPENELPWDQSEELLHQSQDSSKNVATFHAATPKAPLRSLFDNAAPVFFIISAAAFVWKAMRNMKASRARDGSMV